MAGEFVAHVGQVAHVAAKCTEDNSHIFSSTHCGYPAPGYPGRFIFTPFFRIGAFYFTKPDAAGADLRAGRGLRSSGPRSPSRSWCPAAAQNLGELGITFVRDQILRPMIGRRGDSFLPFLVSLFFFIWIMNLMEIIPVAQFPAMSFIAFPVALMLMVYVHLHLPRDQAPGPGRLLREHDPQGRAAGRSCSSWPRWRSSSTSSSGRSPWPSGCSPTCSPGTSCCWCSRWPPGTCSAPSIGLLFSATSFILTVVLTGFEMLIQALQAYIFTILTAQYIGGSLEAGH